jgi:hypothetical protein
MQAYCAYLLQYAQQACVILIFMIGVDSKQ